MSLQTPKVSVIIPVYNVEDFLDECLASIEAQTLDAIEIICLNDGSTDNSLAIMNKHAAHDKRITVINKNNEGYGATCNRGIETSAGEYIAIVEPDDFIDKDMYRAMTSFADSFDIPIDIVKTPWIEEREWNNPKKHHRIPGYLSKRIPTSKAPFTLREQPSLIESHPAIWSALYRRDFLHEHHIRFPKYPGAGWADNPFLIESACQAETIVFLDQMFYHYRSDLPGSTFNHTTEAAIVRPFKRWKDMWAIMKRLDVTDRGIWEAHYLHGFLYIDGAIIDDGWENELVQQGTKDVLNLMDKDIVLHHPKLSPLKKRFYLRQTGQTTNSFISPIPYLKHISHEGYLRLKNCGLKRCVVDCFYFAKRKILGLASEKIERTSQSV